MQNIRWSYRCSFRAFRSCFSCLNYQLSSLVIFGDFRFFLGRVESIVLSSYVSFIEWIECCFRIVDDFWFIMSLVVKAVVSVECIITNVFTSVNSLALVYNYWNLRRFKKVNILRKRRLFLNNIPNSRLWWCRPST